MKDYWNRYTGTYLSTRYYGSPEVDDDTIYLEETLEDCIESGRHLVDCDDDGYCNLCGEQDS